MGTAMKVIIDNDGSSDDIIAFLYLMSVEDITVKAIIVSGTGEVHGPQGAANFADLCCLIGRGDMPIAYGKDTAFGDGSHSFPDALRTSMDNILKDANVPKNPQPNIIYSAFDLLVKTLDECEEQITILVTGPLTNIAELITKRPDLKAKIAKIVIMGGAITAAGNIQILDEKSDNEVAEWNIYADPAAADAVLSSGIRITLVPLDATNQVPMTKAYYDELANATDKISKLIHHLLKKIVDTFNMELFLEHFYLWDPLAAMICADKKHAEFKEMILKINLDSAKTELTDRNDSGAAVVSVAVSINDKENILHVLARTIREHFSVLENSSYKNIKASHFSALSPQSKSSDKGGSSIKPSSVIDLKI